MKGTLYLIPSTLGDSEINNVLPPLIKKIISNLKYFIVENERTARRFLIKVGINKTIDELEFYVLNKHTTHEEISGFLLPMSNGNDMGVISEAGLPAVADPGSEIVKMAHQLRFKVVPLTGPSSIFLSLMASGLNGQSFAFNGYLPINKPERIKKIRFFEQRSAKEKQTQIFIETPYRNIQLFTDIIESCNKSTMLCVAADITLPDEFIKTQSVEIWRKNIPNINKRPCIFLILAV